MPGLIRGVARTAVVAGTAPPSPDASTTAKRGGGLARNKNNKPPTPNRPHPPHRSLSTRPPPAAPSTDDKLAQLQQLGQLRDAGVLTEGEFEAQKGKILA